MFVLDTLQNKLNNPYSVESILCFLENEMTEEKVLDYYSRKFEESKHDKQSKHTKQLFVIEFDSIHPIKLSISHNYTLKNMSQSLKKDKDVLHPLLIGYNIANNQYRHVTRIENENPSATVSKQSTGSFSDYYFSRKLLNTALPDCLQLTTSSLLSEETKKYEILHEFYAIFNDIAKKEVGKKNVGYDFLINFNSIIDLDGPTEEEKKQFMDSLIAEYPFDTSFNYDELMKNRWFNGVIYLLESIELQAFTMYQLPRTNERIAIETILKQPIELPFESPTDQKATLANQRLPFVPVSLDLPKIPLYEMMLLRFLVVSINKQGTTSASGYRFFVAEGEKLPTSIEKTIQLTANAYGNISITMLDLKDIKEIKQFKKSAMEAYAVFFGSKLSEEDAQQVLYAKLIATLELFFTTNQTKKELIQSKLNQRLYKEVGVLLYDALIPTIGKLVQVYETKEKKTVYYNQLVDGLFVVYALSELQNKQMERVNFLTNTLRANELAKKEILTSEEFYFLLGAVSGFTINNSRNRDSLRKQFLRQNRVSDVLELLNKRIAIGIDEIDYLPIINSWLNVITLHLPTHASNQQMTNTEKFAFIAGFVAESIKKKQEEIKNDD